MITKEEKWRNDVVDPDEHLDLDDTLRLGRHWSLGAPNCIKEHRRPVGKATEKTMPESVKKVMRAHRRRDAEP
jgi:hypothetical protein